MLWDVLPFVSSCNAVTNRTTTSLRRGGFWYLVDRYRWNDTLGSLFLHLRVLLYPLQGKGTEIQQHSLYVATQRNSEIIYFSFFLPPPFKSRTTLLEKQ